ncbi:hypothetical protein V1505DRAFT_424339 [Lipomyces doorenjongii]
MPPQIGETFPDKKAFMFAMKGIAVEEGYQFRCPYSDKSRVAIENKRDYKPKHLKADVHTDHKVQVNYYVAWRAKNIVLDKVNGTDIESFQNTFIGTYAPGFGSRLRKKADGNLEFYTPNVFDDVTLPFFWFSNDKSSRPLIADMKLAMTNTVTVEIQGIQDFSRVFAPMAEKGSRDFIDKDRPMTSIYITRYEDYTAMLFAASHMLCDASGLKLLFDGWQKVLNGGTVMPLTDELVLPEVKEIGSAFLPAIQLNLVKKLSMLANFTWSRIKYGKGTVRRIVLSKDLLENLRAKVQSVANFPISRYDVVWAISVRLCAIGYGTASFDMLTGSAVDMRHRVGNNDYYMHNFFVPLSTRVSTHQVLEWSFAELVIRLKSFLRQFTEQPDELVKVFNLLESAKPNPCWLVPYDINMMVTHWGSFNFTHIDFNAAATGGETNSKLGKVVAFEPLMEEKTVSDAVVVVYHDGPNGHGGVVLNHAMHERNWARAKAALGNLEAYIESLIDE